MQADATQTISISTCTIVALFCAFLPLRPEGRKPVSGASIAALATQPVEPVLCWPHDR
jgi:hypothetical protein